MAKYKIKQGNSFWLDITIDKFEEVDSDFANWEGVFSVKKSLSAAAIISGVLIKSVVTDGLMHLRLGLDTVEGEGVTVDWNDLPTGVYIVTCEAINVSKNYSYEEQDMLTVEKQGV